MRPARPMLATAAETLPTDAERTYELKWDSDCSMEKLRRSRSPGPCPFTSSITTSKLGHRVAVCD